VSALLLSAVGALEPARRGMDRLPAAQLPDGDCRANRIRRKRAAGSHPVALGATCCRVMRIDPLQIRCLQLAARGAGRPYHSRQFESRCTMLKSIAQDLAWLVPAEWNRSQASTWPWRKILSDVGLLAAFAVLSSWLIQR
jgi:hypothetical protein